ncbi:hypothetical protein CN491_02245 [Bacillus cereus]|uniref:Uncharacterized protein n=1 Tax=Bacillus cereus TaxID=1396 RepID=A0A2A8LW82_BACCE|nr:hypothetical protein CN491_02245 [Bacillus cereus]PFP70720.1 hypothetical protein COJ95_24135 [Bacillus cereus]
MKKKSPIYVGLFFTLIKKGKHRTFLQTFMHSYSFVIFSSLCKSVHRLTFCYFQKFLYLQLWKP